MPEATAAARERLRAHLRKVHAAYPPVLRLSLALAGAAWLAMAAVVLAAFAADRGLFHDLLWFVAITTVSGGQAAAFYAFRQDPPMPLALVIAMSVLNMAGTLFLIVPLAWRALEGLRDARFVGNVLMAAESMAWRHRRALERWGLVGLSVVAAAPVQGAGVLGAGALGVVLRVPLHLLLLVLALVGVAVNVAWAFVIRHTARALPTGGLWDLLPLAIVALLVLVGFLAARAGGKEKDRVSLDSFSWIGEAQRRSLASLGIKGSAGFLRVDLRRLAARLGMARSDLRRARSVAGLLRLPSVQPDEALRLTEAGVGHIRDLAITPPTLVREAVAEVDPQHAPSATEAAAWHKEAKAFVAEERERRSEKEPDATPGEP
ncbi:MAG TPA: DUF4332 domain-containing protein [Candidatus Thermoplasmatota archaeon]|nr:DUF4332 domain-containing protein [Candidatus Thermoplasmatota archaeon]